MYPDWKNSIKSKTWKLGIQTYKTNQYQIKYLIKIQKIRGSMALSNIYIKNTLESEV